MLKYAEELKKRLREPAPYQRGLQLFLNPRKGNFKGQTGSFTYNVGDDCVNLPSSQLVGFYFQHIAIAALKQDLPTKIEVFRTVDARSGDIVNCCRARDREG